MKHRSTEMYSLQRALIAMSTFLAVSLAIFAYPALSISAAPKATITVTNLGETSSGGQCTLRNAITAANNNTSVFGCTAGSGADTIGFGALSGTIVLTGSLPVVTQDLTINGGNVIILSGNSLHQILYVNGGVNINLNDLRFQNGKGNPSGGAIYNNGNLAITNTTFISNSAASGYGGAIENANGSGLRIVNSTFSNNSSSLGGGAIDTDTMVNLSILNSTFSNNNAPSSYGGAIWIFNISNTTIGNSSFVNNIAGGLGEGGAVRIEASSGVITNSAFFENTAENGAAVSISASTVLITNTTISGNKANKDGGGIQNINSATTTLNNVTLTANSADNNNDTAGNGGGIYSDGGSTLNLKNTILAKNIDLGNEAPDCQATLTTYGNNLLGNNTLCTGLIDGASGDKVGTGASPKDPKLGPLGYYGGATLVHSLLAGSPALDAGNNATCASTDQRGVPRPRTGGNPCDMGAFEGVGCYTLTTSVNPSGSGSVSKNPTPNCNNGTQYMSGTVVTLTANANNGYAFSNWSGDASGTTNPTTVTLNANKNITANFTSSVPRSVFLPLISSGGLPPIIPPTTKVLDTQTTQYLSSISNNGSTFTFSQMTPQLNTIAPGDVMVSGGAPAAPYGFLRKVTSVSNTGGQVIVQTQPTTIAEAVQQGEVSVSQILQPTNLTNGYFAKGVRLMKSPNAPNSFYLQLNNFVLYDQDGNLNTTDDQINANGSVTLDPRFDFRLQVQDFQLKKLYFTMTASQVTQLKIASKVFVTARAEKVLAVYPMGPLFLTIGPFPVTVYPVVTIVAGIDGTISANVSTGLTQTLTETAGASYANGNWTPIQQFSNQFQPDAPALAAGVDIKGYTGAKLQILLYGSVGPDISLNAYLKFQVDPFQTPWWKLYGGLQVPVGISINIFSNVIADYSAIVIDYSVVIAQSTQSIATAITTGAAHTCALTTSGGVKCWGDNYYGELGDGGGGTPCGGGNVCRLTPVDVSGLTSGISAIAAGGVHTCALTTGGGVKCWGDNYFGQLGDGGGGTPCADANYSVCRLTPVDVSGLTSGVTAIAAGDHHTCALTTGGGVKCWGDNYFGQLGDGGGGTPCGGANYSVCRLTPVDVSGLTSGVTAVAAGRDHTCALRTSGGVKCWGSNNSGQLGIGSFDANPHPTPVDVIGLTSGMKAIAAGSLHTCALTTSGGVKCWGDNGWGELGDGTTTFRLTPVDVIGLTSGISAIAAGGVHTCAVTTSGGAKCWGDNFLGDLGDGTVTQRNSPVDVSTLTSGVSATAVGLNHTCALTTSGGVMCWGSNASGQVGIGSFDGNPHPTPVGVVGFGP